MTFRFEHAAFTRVMANFRHLEIHEEGVIHDQFQHN